ncbi:superoxide dismutase [Porphyromonas sp. COT-239 OH1446]|uniref:superoxide dismutase n=1 Tax=Porphyromonas sp. COT-239 OH1446 TaxID=1515613 RepID=UPI00052DF5B0|nr:superoxide dismutase [Porphyromonas sp. COT-239 OH1446]KGN71425.1 superoxide dismutase [Porphyromonas sp. COT-239 OH1446]
MKHELVQLPYELNALEPAISAETLSFHHGKHLAGYVNTLNQLIEGTPLADASLEEIVCNSEGPLFNNAGQTLNHNLYFTQFAPNAGGAPTGKLLAAIEKKWGSFEAFQAEFLTACTTLFGSGWAWLAADANGDLVITKEPNGSNPVVHGLKPLLGIDVWEHAYYLSYQNRRADHVKDVWAIIDWNVVASRY